VAKGENSSGKQTHTDCRYGYTYIRLKYVYIRRFGPPTTATCQPYTSARAGHCAWRFTPRLGAAIGARGASAKTTTMQLLNQTMTLQTCLQSRSLKQRFVSCSRVKRNACKRVTKSTQIRNGMYGTIFLSAASGR
jgi:hypothetical protein